MPSRRRATLLVLLLAASASAAWRAGTAVVPAEDAASAAGSAVTIEGDVATAHVDPDGLVLELAPVGPKSFRAVLVRALISSLPRSPERVYEGKRVRITGIVQRFQGRPEMVLESADQIEIVDVAGTAPTSTTVVTVPVPTSTTRVPPVPEAAAPATTGPAPATSTPAPPAPPAPAAPVAAPAASVPPPPSPAAAVEAPAPPPVPAPPAAPESERKPLLSERLAEQACERARSRWADAAARARDAMAALGRCLDAGSYACRATAAALAPAIGDLEWAEQQVADRCP